MYKCQYFGIKELVSPIVYEKWGEQAWMFFSEDTLRDLDYIRESYGSPIIINNWASGGTLKQCGLRSNMDDLVKSKKTLYLSAHTMGKGFDLHAKNGKNELLYNTVFNLIKFNKLRKFRRLENFKNTGTWVPVDCFQSDYIIFYNIFIIFFNNSM